MIDDPKSASENVLNGILPNLFDQAVAHGIGLQLINSFVQRELADRPQQCVAQARSVSTSSDARLRQPRFRYKYCLCEHADRSQ
jgi:hypothetical protein